MSVQIIEKLNFKDIPKGQITKYKLEIFSDATGSPTYLPVIAARGPKEGPVVGFTAAVHGNELNGIRVIHKLFNDLEADINELCGTIIAVPIVNVPGYLNNQREFNNGSDLNRVMPGKLKGNSSERYAYWFFKKVVSQLDYLLDLHTASFGRVNSLYVRANMDDEKTKKMANLQHPQIIVHNVGRDGSLRSAAAKKGIPAITVEVGDPQKFQRNLIKYSLVGVHNILSSLKMLPIEEEKISEVKTVLCKKSYWIYTDRGGILEVYPQVAGVIKKGQIIARISDPFGETIKEYKAPEDGVVVGKSSNPSAQMGSRILHLGILS